jgi:predicted nucleotidyltransferase
VSGRLPARGPAGALAQSDHYAGEPPTDADVTRVLEEATTALDDDGVPYVVMGGLVAAVFARPRSTDDIDVFVKPEHAARALEALQQAGFEVEEHDPMWLYKAWRRGVLVDVIFRSSGEVYLDDEMLSRAVVRECRGTDLKMIAPEDLLVIKAVATGEHGSHHWYDALGIIARNTIDWDYLVERARQAGPRRVLSLLLYAESNDMAVPAEAVEQLFTIVHPRPVAPSEAAP